LLLRRLRFWQSSSESTGRCASQELRATPLCGCKIVAELRMDEIDELLELLLAAQTQAPRTVLELPEAAILELCSRSRLLLVRTVPPACL